MGSTRLAWVLGDLAPEDEAVRLELSRQLSLAGWQVAGPGQPLDRADVCLVWTHDAFVDAVTNELLDRVAAHRPILLIGSTLTADLAGLREASGLVPRTWVERHPARLRAEGSTSWVRRLTPVEDAIELTTPVLTIDKQREAVDVWVSAPVGLTHHPVMTWNRETAVGVVTVVPDPKDHEAVGAFARLLHLAMRRVIGLDAEGATPNLDVGLLGFGAIGAEHGRAAQALPAMNLAMVCDRSEHKLQDARSHAPGVPTTSDASDLLESDVDVVVVSTPPDTHAEWAVRVLRAGKDVVIEKPFAITTEDADRVVTEAETTGRLAVVYQNRRFDPDYLAVVDTVRSGQLGDVFHLETFIGGYGHPCNYWHSDADVSGGAIYDWGSHVLDQILSVHPVAIDHVTCLEHKRRWLDVTNADHTALHIRFTDGSEASFVHSDLASALKPRWYLLGTHGALTSRWRQASVIARSEIGTLAEDRLGVTDSPPDVILVDALGAEKIVTPPRPPLYPFHRQLMDDRLYGWPMTLKAAQARRVVAVMEAARASAHSRGAPVQVDGEL